MRLLVITNIYPSVSSPASGVFVEQQVEGLRSIGLEVKVVFIDRRREGALAYYRMSPVVRAALREFQPDLIHVMYGGVMADHVTRWAGLPPVVVTFHGSDLLGENLSGLRRKLLSHYGVRCSKKAACRAAGVVVVARHLLKALPFSWPPSPSSGAGLDQPSPLNPQSAGTFSASDGEKVVADRMRCSGESGESVGGMPTSTLVSQPSSPPTLNPQPLPPPIRIIPCGIDLERFQPLDPAEARKKLGWSEQVFHVLFATSASDPVKRPWLARAAVDRLVALGLRAELHILSGVPNQDVPVWINASGALLLTSLHEGSPTIVKEALACGLPVVSVDVGDVAERIEGIEGCYLARAEPDDLAAQLRRVLERRLRIDGGDRLAGLSHLSVARQLESFYREILAGAAKAGKISPLALISADF